MIVARIGGTISCHVRRGGCDHSLWHRRSGTCRIHEEAVRCQWAFRILGPFQPASAPFPEGIEAEGFGGEQPHGSRRWRTGSSSRLFKNEPRSTYPFGLRQTDEASSSRRPVPLCRIRAAAHLGRRRCCRERPRLTPTGFQPATLDATFRSLLGVDAGKEAAGGST